MTKIHYTLQCTKAHSKFLELEATFPTDGEPSILLQLPAWRPGRYELGNFAANIGHFEVAHPAGARAGATAEDLQAEKNNRKAWHKVGQNQWKIECRGLQEVTVRYTYYAAELNAGSTWVDDNQMYVNPVNCFFYLPNRQDVGYVIDLKSPLNYSIASGLQSGGPRQLIAENVQQLMDGPFIAAERLNRITYQIDTIPFYIWIKGSHRLDEVRLLKDFEAFTKAQIRAFGDFPVKDYHFLFQFPDHPTRHGVEHENSTVITLGPAERLTTEDGYKELLGISCHELYHTWNIKSIRPAEMQPYDFSKENFSRLGYVAEGVTTYYGDLYLARSGVIDLTTYFSMLAENIERHLNNPGRFNLSVAESSFDTWVDGYVPGIPNRKVSIYNEGLLTAFLTDVAIMKATGDKKSLDDVMKAMYHRFGKTGVGYTEVDYRNLVEETAGVSLEQVFDRFIYGTDDYLPSLKEAFDYLGVEMILNDRHDFTAISGALISKEDQGYRVHVVAPDSPADRAALAVGDLIISVDDIVADDHLMQRLVLIGRETNKQMKLRVLRHRKLLELEMHAGSRFFPKVKLQLKTEKKSFSTWLWKSS